MLKNVNRLLFLRNANINYCDRKLYLTDDFILTFIYELFY